MHGELAALTFAVEKMKLNKIFMTVLLSQLYILVVKVFTVKKITMQKKQIEKSLN